MVEAISQGQCTECEHSDDNFSVDERTFHSVVDDSDEDKKHGVTREVSCDCGAEATVHIGEDGVTTDGAITHKYASWTPEPDEDEA